MKCSQINRYNEIQIIREMRSPWQLIMWKENNLIKDRHTLKNRLGPGRGAGWRAEGWSALERGLRVKDHCPSQGTPAIIKRGFRPQKVQIQVLIHKIISGAVNRKSLVMTLLRGPAQGMLEAGRLWAG